MSFENQCVAVVIPCFRVRSSILSVLTDIGPEVDLIFIVDDACPEQTGQFVSQACEDSRIRVLTHAENSGVGGATLSGYRAALEAGADLLVKVDGDGQMNPALIPVFLRHLLVQNADYAKGNRLFRLESARSMPRARLFGNLMLSLLTKISSGYWHSVDPTNGFTVLRAEVAKEMPLQKIDRGYFFETDMLFHLNLQRAVVVDVPMQAIYGDERSNLSVRRASWEFLVKNLRNAWRRIKTSYFVRDFNPGSIELVFGLLFLSFGSLFGGYAWMRGVTTDTFQSSGTVMLAALPTLIGIQLLIAFLNFDVANVPRQRLMRSDLCPLRKPEVKDDATDTPK